jgi:hypothetical protein
MFLSIDRTPWLNPDPEWHLIDWEIAMQDVLSKEPFDKLMYSLPYQTYSIMGKIVRIQPEGDPQTIPLSSQVSRRIFLRLMQDLRSVQQLATLGYASGAGAIASTVSEIAFEVAWIGNDEDRAQRWLNHTGKKKTVENFGRRWNEVLSQRYPEESDKKAAETIESEVYSSLCMLKHGNSQLQQGLGSFVGNGVEYFSPTPILTSNTLHALSFSMFHTNRLCLDASLDLINTTRLRISDIPQDLEVEIRRLMSELMAANARVGLQIEFLLNQERQLEKGFIARDLMKNFTKLTTAKVFLAGLKASHVNLQ